MKIERDCLIKDNRIFLIVKGKKGAVVMSRWFNDTTWSLDIHAVKPQRKGQRQEDYMCEFIDGNCYCDGRTLFNGVEGEPFDLLEIEYKSLD